MSRPASGRVFTVHLEVMSALCLPCVRNFFASTTGGPVANVQCSPQLSVSHSMTVSGLSPASDSGSNASGW